MEELSGKILPLNDLDNIQSEINNKIDKVQSEVNALIEEANSIKKTNLSIKIKFSYTHNAPGDFLNPFERAQSICFVTKYEQLPKLPDLQIEKRGEHYYLRNIAYIRHTLNEYRPIIMNQKDSFCYSRIHSFCYKKLANTDPSKGLSVKVINEKKEDVTDVFINVINERIKSINFILKKSEFDYIYNGILQHSDHKYTQKYLEEYSTGKINYVFIKHSFMLDYIKDALKWHYYLLNQLTFPKLGPL